jgi:tRNA (adenine57-N1/adenine58-N1)-methyltransferase
MHGHTGFLITTRRLAPGVTPPLRKRRPSAGFEAADAAATEAHGDATGREEWTAESLGERQTSAKRARKLRRSIAEGPSA